MTAKVTPDTRVPIPPGGFVLPLPPGTFAVCVRSPALGFRLAFGDEHVRAARADVTCYGTHRFELPADATHVAFAPASPAQLVLDVWIEVGAASAARWIRANAPPPKLAVVE